MAGIYNTNKQPYSYFRAGTVVLGRTHRPTRGQGKAGASRNVSSEKCHITVWTMLPALLSVNERLRAAGTAPYCQSPLEDAFD